MTARASLDYDSRKIHVAETVGKNLRRMREDAGLSRPALARMAGVSESLVVNAENGTQAPALVALVAIAEVIDCTLDDFCEGM
jgi:transcriptional regulator with XRE-family HTH domain